MSEMENIGSQLGEVGNHFGDFFGSFGFMFLLPFLIFGLIFIIVIVSIIKANKKHKNTMNRIATTYPDIVQKYKNILEYDPELSALRKECKTYSTIGTIMAIVGFCTFFIFSIVSMAMFIGGIILANIKKGAYSKRFKEHVMKAALKEYDSELTYFPTGCIPEPQYKMARFESYDRYHSEDRVNGKINGYEFIMADVHVEDRREDSDGDTHYVTLFNGPVAILTLPEYINLDLAVVNNRIKLFSGTRVEIDNPEFEEIYDVFSDNEVTTMRVLTPSVTTKLIDMYRKYDFHFELKIINNQMYFRFHCGDLFEANPSDTQAEATGVALYFEILNGIKEIMEEVIEATKFLRKK